MSRVIRITVLVENSVHRRGLLAEHGLAFWIETDSRRVLFDTGQGMVLSSNASELGVDLTLADTVVLSHGHYDHTGGLGRVLQANRRAKVYAHPAVFQSKYARNDDGTSREVGMPPLNEKTVCEQADDVIWTEPPTEICQGLFATGVIPRVTTYEDTGGPFFVDAAGQQPDPLEDDQALFFESSRGTVVLLGCAHAGVINTLQYIRQLTDGKPIHAVLGGMHLLTASRDRMCQTIEAFRQLDVERLGPAHCTGMTATMKLWTAFAGRCFSCSAGATIEFEAPPTR